MAFRNELLKGSALDQYGTQTVSGPRSVPGIDRVVHIIKLSTIMGVSAVAAYELWIAWA